MFRIRHRHDSLVLAITLLAGAAAAPRAGVAGPYDIGAWSTGHLPTWPAPPSARYAACTAYDPVRQVLVEFGGTNGSVSNSETWARTLVPVQATWTQLAAGGPAPPARVGATMVYDPVGDRMIVFGGVGSSGILADTWALSLAGTPAWTQLAPAGAPPVARYQHVAVFDAPRDRMIVFGGATAAGPTNDCWSLDLGGATPAWMPLAPLGTPPVARTAPSAIDDAAGDAMVVFGGTGSLSGEIPHALNDTWTLSLAGTPTWVQAGPAGTLPPARRNHAAVYDPARRRMLVFDGLLEGGPTSDAWSLDLASMTWSSVAAGGVAPGARSDLGAIYDAAHDQYVVFGGHAGAQAFNDGATLDGAFARGWRPLTDVFLARSETGLSFDPVGRRLILFGGYHNGSLGDTWQLPVDGDHVWTRLEPAGTPPIHRFAHSQVYDPVHQRVVLFGGHADVYPPGPLNDVWALDLAGPPTWSPLSTIGTPPTPRYYTAAAYDSRRRQLILFGGWNGIDVTNEVWTLALDGNPQWTHVVPLGAAPAARLGASAFYDPARDRMVVYGGFDGYSTHFGDVWALQLNSAGGPTWFPVPTSGTPPVARDGAAAIYDRARDRMVLFGGNAGYPDQTTWTLWFGAPSPTWIPFAPPGGPPAARFYAVAACDSTGDRMFLFGGRALAGSYFNDTWELSLGAPATPALTSLVDASADPGAARLTWYTPDGAGVAATVERTSDGATWEARASILSDAAGRLTYEDVIAQGGRYGYRLAVGPAGDRTEATWLDVPAAGATLRAGLAGAWPNPSRGAPTLTFTLASGGAAVLDVFDVAGRRVCTRDVAGLGPGTHALDLRGAFPARAGVYLATLRAGGATTKRKFAILP